MKNSKKGISLIVLVITIIVIIILAAAVLLSLQKNNPIENANTAVADSDLDAAQSAFNILMGKVMADCQTSVTIVPETSGNKLLGTTFTSGDSTVVKNSDGTFKLVKTTEIKGEVKAFAVTKNDLGAPGNKKMDDYTIKATTGVIYKNATDLASAQ